MKQIKQIVFVLALWGAANFLTDQTLTIHNSFQTIGTLAFAQDNEEQSVEVEDAEQDPDSPCPECPECPDPAKVVLRGLEEKRLFIDTQQKIMEKQKKDLAVFEEQIDEKLIQLGKLQEQIKSDMALLEEKKSQKEQEQEAAYEAKIGRLVKMYAGMKPKSAALIVDTLDLEVAQEIFLRMREASASQILSLVDSQKAAKISERLAYKKK